MPCNWRLICKPSSHLASSFLVCVCVGVCYIYINCCKVQEHIKLLLFHLSGLEASADLAVLSVAVAAVGYKDQVQESSDSVC